MILTSCSVSNPVPTKTTEVITTTEGTTKTITESTITEGNTKTEPVEPEKIETTIYGELTDIGTYAPAEVYTDRALIAIKEPTRSLNGIMVSWRSYQADSDMISFTLERNGTIIRSEERRVGKECM